MVTGYGGPDARVDADKEDAQAGPDAVLQPQLRPLWFNNSAFRFHIDLRYPALVFSSSVRTSLGPFCVIRVQRRLRAASKVRKSGGLFPPQKCP